MKKVIIAVVVSVVYLSIVPLSVSALPYEVESKHFTISYQKGVDVLSFAYDIKLENSLYFQELGVGDIKANSPKELLSQNVEVLFKEVSDILDMHIYSYKGNIKIFKNKKALKDFFQRKFDRKLKFRSFYSHGNNTIYISADDVKVGMLVHEIAHAIINHFFAVMPPKKVQEVLSGFVEYNIRKKTK